jgi:hypothetical protein
VRQYEPPKLSADVIAALAIPSRPHRLSAQTVVLVPDAPVAEPPVKTAAPGSPREKARGRTEAGANGAKAETAGRTRRGRAAPADGAGGEVAEKTQKKAAAVKGEAKVAGKTQKRVAEKTSGVLDKALQGRRVKKGGG